MLIDGLFNWKFVAAIFDILVVYLLIYKTLLLVKGTRAEYILKGLAVVVIVYSISGFLNLVTLNWLLGNFLGSVILVVVVLFQDDIRRGLMKVGLFQGVGSETTEIIENTVGEISKAAAELSSRHIGALIVLRRDIGLEDYTEHAVLIDAHISRQLLISIFLPSSPLHDGAVIVQGDRITGAGAVLPLSFRSDLASDYGTRHRAAIGLSERTDALVIVVSEESGTISLVKEGKVTKDLDQKGLYNALYRLTIFRNERIAKAKERNKGSKGLAGTLGIASKTKSQSAEVDEVKQQSEHSEEEVV